MERKKYSIRAQDYELYEAIGQGVSGSVHRALCIPFNEVVAIKILDFERTNSDLNNISREAQIMILIDHPNVLNAHCSFVNDHNLWVVMPYMAGGSCLHIMKSVYPNGFEEVVIATVLREVLKGLEYLHHHGHIHRDVKAGNILVDSKGGVKLGDFGVSACLFDSGDRQRSRNTFVGTPCWMAPEVMEQLHGYDFKADIWSFGITALELAHGHAPFSKYPPMKVLLMTLQNAPPGLDYERDRKFSKSFKQMIAMCLVKDPSKRPTAHKLLKQQFFKQARSQDYISRKILDGLPTLGVRHQAIKEKEEDMVAQKKVPDVKKEEISQNEYKRGISSWNFDIEDLKTQASLDSVGSSNSLFEVDALQTAENTLSLICSLNYETNMESDGIINKSPSITSPDQTTCDQRNKADGSHHDSKSSNKCCTSNMQNGVLDSDKENGNNRGSSEHDAGLKNFDKSCIKLSNEKKSLTMTSTSDLVTPSPSPSPSPSHERRFSMGSCQPEVLLSFKGERQQNQQNIGNCSGDVCQTTNEVTPEVVLSKSSDSLADELDDKSKPPVIQQRGRFKVTSEKVDLEKSLPPIGLQKSHSLQAISQLPSPNILSPSDTMPNASFLFQQMLGMLQASLLQRDYALSAMKHLSTGDQSVYHTADVSSSSASLISSLEAAHEREKELLQEVSEMQYRIICKDEEIQRLKAKLAHCNVN